MRAPAPPLETPGGIESVVEAGKQQLGKSVTSLVGGIFLGFLTNESHRRYVEGTLLQGHWLLLVVVVVLVTGGIVWAILRPGRLLVTRSEAVAIPVEVNINQGVRDFPILHNASGLTVLLHELLAWGQNQDPATDEGGMRPLTDLMRPLQANFGSDTPARDRNLDTTLQHLLQAVLYGQLAGFGEDTLGTKAEYHSSDFAGKGGLANKTLQTSDFAGSNPFLACPKVKRSCLVPQGCVLRLPTLPPRRLDGKEAEVLSLRGPGGERLRVLVRAAVSFYRKTTQEEAEAKGVKPMYLDVKTALKSQLDANSSLEVLQTQITIEFSVERRPLLTRRSCDRASLYYRWIGSAGGYLEDCVSWRRIWDDFVERQAVKGKPRTR